MLRHHVALEPVPRRRGATAWLFVCSLFVALIAGFGTQASATDVPSAPSPKDCGDMAGPVWRLLPAGEKKGATGSHYTVSASNMPCALARSLTARMIRKRSPGPGFSTSLLPGYLCLSKWPAGRPLVIGGCAFGANPMPAPGARSFKWHHCQFVLGTGAHPACRWAYFSA